MILLIFFGGLIVSLIGLFALFQHFKSNKDLIRIWLPISIILSILVWFLRYDYGNFDDKAQFYLGSAVVRTAPTSTKWINSNLKSLESKMKGFGNDLSFRYKHRLLSSFNYITTGIFIWIVDEILTTIDGDNIKFDLRRAASSVFMGLLLQWVLAFFIFLIIIKWLSKEDIILLRVFVVGIIVSGLSIFYWDYYIGSTTYSFFTYMYHSMSIVFANLILFIISSSKKNVTILMPIILIFGLTDITRCSIVSAIIIFMLMFLIFTEKKYYPQYLSKYITLIVALIMNCIFLIGKNIIDPKFYIEVILPLTNNTDIQGFAKSAIMNPINIFVSISGFLMIALIFNVYRSYVERAYLYKTSLVEHRMLVICAMAIVFIICFRYIKLVPSSLGYTQYVRLFIVGTVSVAFYKYLNNMFQSSTFKKMINVSFSFIILYFIIQFSTAIAYKPWSSEKQMRSAYQNVFELNKLAKPLYNLLTLKFLNDEREIFVSTFGVNNELELKKNIYDMDWVAENPSPTKYETLIILKISKMLIEEI